MKSGHLYLILAGLLLGTLGIFVRFIALPTPLIAFGQALVTSVLMLGGFLIASKKRQPANSSTEKRGALISLVISGAAFTLTSISLYYAFSSIDVFSANILFYIAPVYVALTAPIFLKEKLEPRTLAALAISFLGIILIGVPQWGGISFNLLGMLAGVVSGLAFATMIIYSKKASSVFSSYEIVWGQQIITAVLLFPFVLSHLSLITPRELLLIFLMSVVTGLLGRWLFFKGVALVKAQHVGIIAYTEPLSAALYAFLFFNEIMSAYTLIGGVLIVFGGILVVRGVS